MEKIHLNKKLVYYISYLVIIALFNVISLFYLDWQIIVAANAFLLLILFFSSFPVVGLYIFALLYPFSGWYFISGNFNAPYHDIIGMLLLGGMVLRSIILYLEEKKHAKQILLKIFPGFVLFGLFVLASLVSTVNNDSITTAIKYLLRPISFFYLVYVLLPINIIKTKKVLLNVLKLMVASGVFAGILGLLSTIFSEGSIIAHRAVPYQLFGYNLLGGNHNAIAEIMIVTIPLLIILFLKSNNYKSKGWYIVGSMFSVIVLLLTFSRTGWLALLLQLIVLYFAFYKKSIKKTAVSFVALFVIVALFSSYFILWNQITEVQGSTSSRLMMTQISVSEFIKSPIVGHGLNNFNLIIGSTFAYWVEFGDALDAHGMIQKQMVESGILGLGTFCLLISYFLYNYYKQYRISETAAHKKVALVCLMLAVGVVFFQFFSTSYYGTRMWFPLAIGFTILTLQQKRILN
jgi:hypothetical protein